MIDRFGAGFVSQVTCQVTEKASVERLYPLVLGFKAKGSRMLKLPGEPQTLLTLLCDAWVAKVVVGQPLLQENIRVDTNATRDIDTAQALLRGFGLDEALYTPDPCLFKPEDCGMCAAYPDDALQAAVAARFGQVPRPANLKRKLEALQDFVLG